MGGLWQQIPHSKGARAEAKQIKQETKREGAGFRFEPAHPMAFHITAEAEKRGARLEALGDSRWTFDFHAGNLMGLSEKK